MQGHGGWLWLERIRWGRRWGRFLNQHSLIPNQFLSRLDACIQLVLINDFALVHLAGRTWDDLGCRKRSLGS